MQYTENYSVLDAIQTLRGWEHETICHLLLLLVIMIPLAETAHAKDEIITYEQLLAIDEPCTVYVEGKTGDPYPMHMKETLMSSTQWQWLIKDSSGKYRPSGTYVNMTAYQAMGISKRGLILNHKDCRLEVHVSGKGQWSVASFRVVDTPITFSGIFWPIFFMVAIFAVTVPLIIRGINAPPARNQPRQWQPSKTLLAAYFLSELFKDNGKKK
mgnify:CR=1 FL=1